MIKIRNSGREREKSNDKDTKFRKREENQIIKIQNSEREKKINF